jgi:hypothetical protein
LDIIHKEGIDLNRNNNETKVLGSLLNQGRRDEEILIVSSIDKAGSLKKGTIIAHDTSKEVILLQIVQKITLTDISEQDLYLMSENEKLAYQIIQRSPKSYTLYCRIVGSIRHEEDKERVFSENISFLADKTTEVRSLNKRELKLIYDKGILQIGKTLEDYPVTFPINGLLQRHLSVIGMTGCGKSYLLGVLCEELSKYKAAILIIDPHNEYLSMIQSMPKEVNRMLYSLGDVSGLIPYTLDVKRMNSYDFKHFTGMGEGSTVIVQKVIQKLRKEKTNYNIQDIIDELNFIVKKNSPSEAVAAMWAKNYLQNLIITGIIGTKEPPIKEMVKTNQIATIAMSGAKEKIQQFVVTSVLQKIFEARKKEIIPPVVLIIEEAHRFSPSTETVSSNTIMRTLATEGRKFGICLIVVSQRPNRLDSTVLSQCVTNIVMKIKNPVDLNTIRTSAENATEDIIHQLPRFERGEALIMGESFPISIRFKVKTSRLTKQGGKNVDFEGIWSKHSDKEEIKYFKFPDEL